MRFTQATPYLGQDNEYHFCYVVINKINGKLYFGKHSTPKLEDGYIGSGKGIKLAIRKYGNENFQRIELAFCDSSELAYDLESVLIDKEIIKCRNTYNRELGGYGWPTGIDNPSHRMSEETKRKIGIAVSGRKHKKESIELMKKVSKGRKMSENCMKAMKIKNSREYQLYNPDGVLTKIKNMNEFCQDKDLDPNEMRKVNKGIRSNHRGWTKNGIYKQWKFKDGNGNIFITKNLEEFCIKHNLNSNCMRRIAKGKRKHYKGWTFLCAAHLS